MKDYLIRFAKWLVANWREVIRYSREYALAGATLTLIGISYSRFWSTNPGAVGAFAAASLLFIASLITIERKLASVADSHEKLRENILPHFLPQRYDSLSQAYNDIVESTWRLACKSGGKPLRVQVVDSNLLLTEQIVARLIGRFASTLRTKSIAFTAYHLDPNREEGWPESLAKENDQFQKTAAQCRNAKTTLTKLLTDSEIVACEPQFIQYTHHPMFYAWIIGQNEMFVSFFNWEAKDGNFNAATHPCYRIKNTDEYFLSIYEWIVNRCSAFEQWKGLDEIRNLGFLRSYPDRRSLTDIIANLEDTTRRVRMLSFSGEYNFTNSRALERLKELMIHKSTIVEFALIDSESPFVHARFLEHKEHGDRGLKSRAINGEERVKLILSEVKDSIPEDVPHPGNLKLYDMWATWRLLFVEDDDEPRVYVSFYPIDEHGHHSRVWVFKADAGGRSLYWPLLKQFFAYKYYGEYVVDEQSTEREVKDSTKTQRVESIMNAVRGEMSELRKSLQC